MTKTLKEQLSMISEKPSEKHGSVTVTYKSKSIKDRSLQKDVLLAYEKKALEARRVSLIEKEVENLKFKLAQQSDALEYEKRRFLLLEQENAKLRGSKTSTIEKVEKIASSNVTKSKEYKELLLKKTDTESEVKSIKKELSEMSKSHKKLCVDISRILKKTIQEATITKAKRELHLRRIKEMEEGNLSVLTEIVAVLSYDEN
jgi:glutamyl/glutaminyl-tRNA synthetase